ncbi:recombinase family protein [Streptomyces sp. NBC_01314]|uniref:recombinase family protein n=1 Tax=Streptomyces sp. NBC_01314 TaxID=2903821 RepID=UPI00352C9324
MRLSRSREDDSITTQVEDVEALATSRGLKLAHIYRDSDISAAELPGRTSKTRPDFNAMMAAVNRGEISHILVRNTDRLTRSRRERVDVYEALARHSVSLLVLRGVDVDLASASGRLVAGVLAEVAAHEVEAQSERTRRALRRRLELGLPAGSARVFGYTADSLELVEAEADAVRAAFASLLAGSSLTGIARQLNATGLLTRGGKPHSAGTCRHLLANLRYAAVREDADGKVWPGVWPRIVDEDTVRAARALLGDEGRRTSPGPASRWALSSIGRCGMDGCAHLVTSGSRGGKGDAGPVAVYRCAGPVKHLARAATPIDEYMRALVAAVVDRDRDELLADDGEDPAVQSARDEVARCRRKLDALADAYADSDDADDVVAYRDARRAVNVRQRAAEAVLEGAQQSSALVGVVDTDDVQAAVNALPLDRFRSVITSLFESVTLLSAAGLPKTLGFQPSSVAVVLKGGRPKPAVPGETVTLDLGAPAVARDLADTLRSGGFPVQVKRGGRVVVPADAAAMTQQWKADWDLGFTYDLDPQSAVTAAVRRIAAGAPELDGETKQAVRAALA